MREGPVECPATCWPSLGATVSRVTDENVARPISRSMSSRTTNAGANSHDRERDLGRFGDKRLGCVGGALLDSMERQQANSMCPSAGEGQQPGDPFGRFPGQPGGDDAGSGDDGASRPAGAWPGGTCWRSRTPPICISLLTRPASAASARPGMAGILACSCIRCWRRRRTAAGSVGLVDCVVPGHPQQQVADLSVTGGGGEGVAPLAAWRRGGRRTAGERGADHRGGGPGERYLRLVRPSAGVSTICCAVRRRIASWWAASCCRSSAPDGWSRTMPRSACHRVANEQNDEATVALRFGTVTLQREHWRPREPPRDCRRAWRCRWWMCRRSIRPRGWEPVHWRLLTTHAVTSVTRARQIVTWCSCAGSSNRSSVR